MEYWSDGVLEKKEKGRQKTPVKYGTAFHGAGRRQK
jgi:hypothetical protein